MAIVADTRDHSPRTKPFLGGWRNTVTGLIYHNACTQTQGCERIRNTITQTVSVVDAVTDIVHHQAVQVHFLPDTHDRIVSPGIFSCEIIPVEGTEQLSCSIESRILDSVVKIQRYYRSYQARTANSTKIFQTTINVCRDDEEHPLEHMEHLQTLSVYNGIDFMILNHRLPRRRSDFESLHNMLDRWRILETEQVRRMLFGSSRIAACGLILSKEIKLLRAIDSMKIAIWQESRERKRRKFLDDLSKSIVWQTSSGRPILVDTPCIQQAHQYRDMYASLANVNLSVGARIDLLCELKRIASMHTCNESLELVYLVDQELNLLTRCVDTDKLNWLRNRLKLSFLKLARNALQDNLEENLNRFGWSNTSIMRLCRTCDRLLPLEKFSCEQRLRSFSCIYCVSMQTRKGPRIIYEPYEKMLREIRRFETRMGCYGSSAFVIGVKLVYRLVNEIWHGKSSISECYNLNELRLIRFRYEHEWTPWNSLLLTKTEAAIHQEIIDIERFYDSMLLQKFYIRNLQAKLHFESISKARRNIVTPSSMEN